MGESKQGMNLGCSLSIEAAFSSLAHLDVLERTPFFHGSGGWELESRLPVKH